MQALQLESDVDLNGLDELPFPHIPVVPIPKPPKPPKVKETITCYEQNSLLKVSKIALPARFIAGRRQVTSSIISSDSSEIKCFKTTQT